MTDTPTPDQTNDRHREKMQKRKVARDKIMASKTEERGLIIVHTGKGKGKSSAAWGMAARCIGHGYKIGIVQFIKGRGDTGEHMLFTKFPDQVTYKIMGEGFTWETQDRERDIEMAGAAWKESKKLMADPEIRMVILDELNIALRYDYVDLDDVLDTLAHKRADLHVVVTGRNAKDELIELADLVTEMTLVKHPFREGVKSQPGIEF
ncbi:MAG: cob(I)yrinic acid a,c-diamide adenosyltransferase [Rhodospirillaceae bacterium]|nr:cob(I)yrinic acid a,c-diamide adenosyltransferase [Rhodospirillaceae bacterium]|tara:strand:- start:1945 stop:2565 length:621 start_codon:yes stop_codon:yes gene_type:complete